MSLEGKNNQKTLAKRLFLPVKDFAIEIHWDMIYA
jgi:hypothetical protein